MKVKFKRLNELARIPSYAKHGDACFDFVATSVEHNSKFIEYGTGIAVEVPQGHVGLIFSRSSVSNTDLMLKNGVGVIDSGYRGEIKFRFYNLQKEDKFYEIGERIGQMMILPIPSVELEEVYELTDTQRGEGGYGSSGR